LVAAFNEAGHVLLLKRHAQQHCGGLWSFPGGKVEAEEDEKIAAERELQEETGLIGSGWKELGRHSFTYPDRHLNFVLFQCLCTSVAHLDAESEHTWVAFHQLSDYPMPAANGVLLRMLENKEKGIV